MLALDQGTTSSRCILFDKQGNICSMAQKEFEQIYPQAGWVEHDPMEIWASQLSVATEAISKIGAAAEEIAGIGRSVCRRGRRYKRSLCRTCVYGTGCAVLESGVDIVSLKVDGGASNNDFLMQFQADILNVDVLRPKCVETTALGAAYQAGLAVGCWKDIHDIRKNWALSRVFHADVPEEQRSRKLAGWKRAVRCALAWMEEA